MEIVIPNENDGKLKCQKCKMKPYAKEYANNGSTPEEKMVQRKIEK